MKVACLLYGQPRDYISGYNKIMDFFFKQPNISVDFFYHCWVLNNNEKFSASPWRNIDSQYLNYNCTIEEELKNLYKPISFEYENQNKIKFDDSVFNNTIAYYNTTHEKNKNINNTLYQLYSRNKVRNLLASYTKNSNTIYDFVIMVRFDILHMPNIFLNKLDLSKIHISNILLPRKIIPDNCIISPLKIFLEWFNIYEELNLILDNKNLEGNLKLLDENLEINPEELIFAKFIFHYNNIDNISYFSGGTIV
jgi:hypothetical protein